MKISEILKKKSTISFEVFPPKNKEGDISSIYSTIEGLAKLSPDFISVTYGAGGSTKGKTVEIASVIKHEYGIESVAHLSCISSTKEDIKYECERLKEAGNYVEIHRIPDALHGYFALGIRFLHVQESFEIMNRFLNKS